MLVRYGKTKDGAAVKRAEIYTKEEHSIRRQDIDPDAVSIILRLKAAGHTAYVVGGAVRDLLVGKVPKDFDIATDAHPRKIKRLFRNSRIIGKRFRLVHVYFGSKIIEVSTFRSLHAMGELNQYGSIHEDVQRRDFSLNALYYCPVEEIVIDYVGGVKDIRNKVIRPIIPLKQIFVEDPVRMVRAVKYSAMLGFSLPFFTRRMIQKQASLLSGCSHSRLTEELFKILGSGASAVTLKALHSLKLLRHFLPSLDFRLQENRNNFYDRFFRTLDGYDVSEPEIEERAKGLAALLKDHLEDLNRESRDVPLQFKDFYLAAKEFFRPLSPPNREVDQAVMMIFRETRPKKSRRRRRRKPKGETPDAKAIETVPV